MTITLTPSYGRDYTSQTKVKEAFYAGKDFNIATYGYGNQVTNVADLKRLGFKEVNIRYAKATKVVVIKVNGKASKAKATSSRGGKKLSFRQWMNKIDGILYANIGLYTDDLGDVCYRDYFDSGISPQEVANEVIANEFS